MIQKENDSFYLTNFFLLLYQIDKSSQAKQQESKKDKANEYKYNLNTIDKQNKAHKAKTNGVKQLHNSLPRT
ncbi:MAG: hypothetical protein UV38_C0002G0196 [candidate division TM6 bacterium GW2011_GWE2_42_60]|nr:MAG: hypothetical protein UV38_C0002G0196 [candidate division TM6 bacterium GW2011_GWE2_42_60]